MRLDCKAHFAAGSDEDKFWILVGSISEDVRSFGDTGG